MGSDRLRALLCGSGRRRPQAVGVPDCRRLALPRYCRSSRGSTQCLGGPDAPVADRSAIFGCCEEQNGIGPFGRLVEQVITRPSYNDARRVFWIVDNCSAHRGSRAVQRLQSRYPNVVLVHPPIHASWLTQVEICFSIVQRKILTPNDFPDLDLAERLLDFQYYWEAAAKPFEWKFTRQDLSELLHKLNLPQ